LNKLHGRGILLDQFEGKLHIGYFNDGISALGNYIRIYSDGYFQVGNIYKSDNGEMMQRGTRYKNDGSKEEYGI
jgi:hypothetical protein